MNHTASTHHSWLVFAVSGFIALVYGIVALFLSEEIITAIALYTGLLILLSGAGMLIAAIYRLRKDLPFVSLLMQAIVAGIIGILIILYTQHTIAAFLTVIGAMTLVSALFQAYLLAFGQHNFNNKGVDWASVVITLVFGIVLLYNPYAVAAYLVVISGILALLAGSLMLWFAVKIRKMQ